MRPIIGLEVHVQLRTESKLFCSCSNILFSENLEPNFAICPICVGLPGTLPRINELALKYALLVATAIGCEIPKICKFARKNYFYPDLPKGYQISQYHEPLGRGGNLPIFILGDDKKTYRKKEINFRRLNLEEDAAKFIHLEDTTLVDFNRCGIPLLELVTEPQLESAHETIIFLKQLRCLLLYLKVSDCSMEKGSLRVDVNVSIGDKDSVRIEIKNLNSFAAIEEAIEYELNRLNNEKIGNKPQTRLWDEDKKITKEMRRKEESKDYRYFPEPDLLPVNLKPYKRGLDLELPWQKFERFYRTYSPPLAGRELELLVEDFYLAELFEKFVRMLGEDKIKSVCSWLLNELRSHFSSLNITPKDIIRNFAIQKEIIELISNVEEKRLVRLNAKEYIADILRGTIKVKDIVEKEATLSTSEVEELVKEVIMKNIKAVEEYKSGKSKVLGYLIGEVMKRSKKRADPKEIQKLLQKLLN